MISYTVQYDLNDGCVHIKDMFLNKLCFFMCHSQTAAMKVGGLIKLGTLGRGLMTQLTICWSVCVLEMAKESGLANLWVSTFT